MSHQSQATKVTKTNPAETGSDPVSGKAATTSPTEMLSVNAHLCIVCTTTNPMWAVCEQYEHKSHQSTCKVLETVSVMGTTCVNTVICVLHCATLCYIIQPMSFGANSATFLVPAAISTFCWKSILVQTAVVKVWVKLEPTSPQLVLARLSHWEMWNLLLSNIWLSYFDLLLRNILTQLQFSLLWIRKCSTHEDDREDKESWWQGLGQRCGVAILKQCLPKLNIFSGLPVWLQPSKKGQIGTQLLTGYREYLTKRSEK